MSGSETESWGSPSRSVSRERNNDSWKEQELPPPHRPYPCGRLVPLVLSLPSPPLPREVRAEMILRRIMSRRLPRRVLARLRNLRLLLLLHRRAPRVPHIAKVLSRRNYICSQEAVAAARRNTEIHRLRPRLPPSRPPKFLFPSNNSCPVQVAPETNRPRAKASSRASSSDIKGRRKRKTKLRVPNRLRLSNNGKYWTNRSRLRSSRRQSHNIRLEPHTQTTPPPHPPHPLHQPHQRPRLSRHRRSPLRPSTISANPLTLRVVRPSRSPLHQRHVRSPVLRTFINVIRCSIDLCLHLFLRRLRPRLRAGRLRLRHLRGGNLKWGPFHQLPVLIRTRQLQPLHRRRQRQRLL